LKFKIEKSPNISKTRRLVFAFLGGVFFVYGAQLARGCTSGAALSGMAVLSVAGFVTMVAIFGSAYLFACSLERTGYDLRPKGAKAQRHKAQRRNGTRAKRRKNAKV